MALGKSFVFSLAGLLERMARTLLEEPRREAKKKFLSTLVFAIRVRRPRLPRDVLDDGSVLVMGVLSLSRDRGRCGSTGLALFSRQVRCTWYLLRSLTSSVAEGFAGARGALCDIRLVAE